MFKIYNLNYEEIPLPVDRLGYGIKGLDIHIGPIIYDTVYNQVNGVDTPIKRYPVDRDVYINILSKSADTIDWRMKRDEMYSFFRNLGVFYIAEKHQPFKLLKVMVDVDYYVDRPVTTWGLAEITLKIVDTPFKQSLHTTGTIGSEGMLFNNKWAYAMGTQFDESHWKYSFTDENPRFFNAGTEDVKLINQNESEITLTIGTAPANDVIEIYDGETTFRLNRECNAGDALKIKGKTVTLNDENVLGDTNFNFLTVKKGWNDWEVRGVTDYEFKIDFRYLYD